MNLELTFTLEDFEELESLNINLSDNSGRDELISARETVKEKLRRVASEFYGSDRVAKDWANHLREIRDKLKDLIKETVFSCPKCGKPHKSERYEDEGCCEESGRTFYYCSNGCRISH